MVQMSLLKHAFKRKLSQKNPFTINSTDNNLSSALTAKEKPSPRTLPASLKSGQFVPEKSLKGGQIVPLLFLIHKKNSIIKPAPKCATMIFMFQQYILANSQGHIICETYKYIWCINETYKIKSISETFFVHCLPPKQKARNFVTHPLLFDSVSMSILFVPDFDLHLLCPTSQKSAKRFHLLLIHEKRVTLIRSFTI